MQAVIGIMGRIAVLRRVMRITIAGTDRGQMTEDGKNKISHRVHRGHREKRFFGVTAIKATPALCKFCNS